MDMSLCTSEIRRCKLRAQHLLFHPGQESSLGVSKGMSALDSASQSTPGKQGLLTTRAQWHRSVTAQRLETKVWETAGPVTSTIVFNVQLWLKYT